MVDDPSYTHKSHPAHELADVVEVYYVPAAKVQQICPELKTIVDEAIEDRTALAKAFEVPRELGDLWKDWWTVNDYIIRGKSLIGCVLNNYEPKSSFLTDANVYILATRCNHQFGAEAAGATTKDRADEMLEYFIDAEFTFDKHFALADLESLIAAARLACSDWRIPAQQDSTTTTTGTAGGGRAGLRAMVLAACVRLGPLLAEVPALRTAALEDAEFAALWEGVTRGGLAPGWFTPIVRDRIQRLVEGRDVVDSV